MLAAAIFSVSRTGGMSSSGCRVCIGASTSRAFFHELASKSGEYQQGDGPWSAHSHATTNVAMAPHAQGQGIVPAVAERESDAVVALLEDLRDIVGAE